MNVIIKTDRIHEKNNRLTVVNDRGFHWWQLSFVVKGPLPSDSKPLLDPMLSKFCHAMSPGAIELTHWGWVLHICISKLTVFGSDNGLLPGRRQAIIWTNVGIFLIGPPGTHFSEILIKIYTFSFKKMHLKMLSGKWRPFCLGLNVLIG